MVFACIRNLEYLIPVTEAAVSSPRWELYKLLSEPMRLRLLALANQEELAIGELAELTGEQQPNVSRHLKPLRRLGLLVERKEGTRVYVRLDRGALSDPVVADAERTGRRLCEEDGSAARIPAVLRAREAPSRAYFDGQGESELSFPTELGAYLAALAPLIPQRSLAVDIGTGDGSFLEVLAPIFRRVVALDRSAARVEQARQRMSHRGFSHVELEVAELADDSLPERFGGADAVFAARVLHHAPVPGAALKHLAALAAPGGAVIVVDYDKHDDEAMRAEHADTWLGFEERELTRAARAAGLEDVSITSVPALRCGDGPDGHLNWIVLVGRRPTAAPCDN